MGGQGSGRKPTGQGSKLTVEQKIEKNRVRARERWQRLRVKKEEGGELKGMELYKLHYREQYHKNEERLGHLRESSKGFRVDEDPIEWIKYIKEKNKSRLDAILNDAEAMERIFKDRDDITELQRNAQRQKKYMSEKEIKDIEKKLNEEFNLVEDRRTPSTYKPTTDDNN
jgi:hypothetical protein